ncbi:MAG: 2Fe-2S iron-sulfur cluster-binding protein [Pseudomonadota bacterium]|nr:2Fe-2S iron-sulfur cluster-binding protein [Pseudomonadota bacterium]
MPRVIFITANGEATEVRAEKGTTLLQLAQSNDVAIEGACEGSLACSTCHVIVENEWFSKLLPPTEEEEDMLDLCYDVRPTSRLGCQILITDELDGLVVNLPPETRNMMF